MGKEGMREGGGILGASILHCLVAVFVPCLLIRLVTIQQDHDRVCVVCMYVVSFYSFFNSFPALFPFVIGIQV